VNSLWGVRRYGKENVGVKKGVKALGVGVWGAHPEVTGGLAKNEWLRELLPKVWQKVNAKTLAKTLKS